LVPADLAGLRVLQAMAGAPHGGAEAFFERLVIALHRRSLPQKVVIRSNEGRAMRLTAEGLDLLQLPFGGALDLATGRQLRAIALDYKPHIVLTWMNRATAKMPKGDFVHIGRLGGYYQLKHYRHCDYLIGNTPDIVRWLVEEQDWPKDKAICIPNFVESTRMAPRDRSSLATPAGKKLALAVGRLHENKGFDVLLRALALLPGIYLWLAGEGPQGHRLKALADELGVSERVRFLGWRDDIPALLAAADVFVSPPRHEPLGNVVLEAWANGVPVVAAAAQGPRYLIAAGENGMLVGIDRPDELAAAIGKVLANDALAERLAQAGRATYEARFTEDKIVADYLGFFERCAGSPA